MKILSANEASAVFAANNRKRLSRTVCLQTNSEEVARGYEGLAEQREGGIFKGVTGNKDTGYYEAWFVYWREPARRKTQKPPALCDAWILPK